MEDKIYLGTAKVYAHPRNVGKGVYNHHLDIDAPFLVKIIGNEKTVCGGYGYGHGIWIGMKKCMVAEFFNAVTEAEGKK